MRELKSYQEYIYFHHFKWRKCNVHAIRHMVDSLKIKDLKYKKDMNKYQEGIVEEGVGTSNGFWYDLTDGGYIKPEEILTDENRVKELNDAIQLLEDWRSELEEDGVLNEF